MVEHRPPVGQEELHQGHHLVARLVADSTGSMLRSFGNPHMQHMDLDHRSTGHTARRNPSGCSPQVDLELQALRPLAIERRRSHHNHRRRSLLDDRLRLAGSLDRSRVAEVGSL